MCNNTASGMRRLYMLMTVTLLICYSIVLLKHMNRWYMRSYMYVPRVNDKEEDKLTIFPNDFVQRNHNDRRLVYTESMHIS